MACDHSDKAAKNISLNEGEIILYQYHRTAAELISRYKLYRIIANSVIAMLTVLMLLKSELTELPPLLICVGLSIIFFLISNIIFWSYIDSYKKNSDDAYVYVTNKRILCQGKDYESNQTFCYDIDLQKIDYIKRIDDSEDGVAYYGKTFGHQRFEIRYYIGSVKKVIKALLIAKPDLKITGKSRFIEWLNFIIMAIIGLLASFYFMN